VTSDAGDRMTIAMKVIVVPLTLPDHPSLHVGGWDYTDVDERYGVNPKNRSASSLTCGKGSLTSLGRADLFCRQESLMSRGG